ncbi:AAA ATPase [Hyella patelloides LEGE 07179]|uniref:AAA ATPase n=1 Tax=Hyella patelloides LEGE 07179 TaxID=945734 RepID=A0A563VP75_9CYAN|nr:NB-ARC domain-containing protein [Hyella patelloides]VEP13214.1 AAA ATPase [Hyella patelloides LEGE 07179]
MIQKTIEEQLFLVVAENWNLELLYQDLANVKRVNITRKAKLSPIEKAMLRGLLAGYSPKEIASKLYWTAASVGVELSKGIYRYVEALTDRESNALKSWRDVAKWLEEAGYKTKNKTHNISINCGELPEVTQFYGREPELTQLKQWIVEKRDRLVMLSGMVGIGKTTLAAHLTQEIKSDFECIIWCNLKYQSSLSHILVEILDVLSPNGKSNDTVVDINIQINQLLKYLQEQRCLLILDGLENTMSAGSFAGFYQKKYQEYSQLMKRIATENHQSCLLVTSQDEPIDMPLLQGNNVHTLSLNGLGEAAKNIFLERNLSSFQFWDELISCYCGNPLALKLIAAIIRDLFNGNVASFLDANNNQTSNILPIYFKKLFEQQLERLSNLEIEILRCLVSNNRPICFNNLQDHLASESNAAYFIQALNSLRRRSLIDMISENNNTCFQINNIIKAYFSTNNQNKFELLALNEY